VHETGWPTRGLRHHSPEKQRAFWSCLFQVRAEAAYRFVIFEAFDQPWKHELYQGVDIGTSWGIFDAQRRPKPVVDILCRPHQNRRSGNPPLQGSGGAAPRNDDKWERPFPTGTDPGRLGPTAPVA
jgi:hypothetical protein